jgi:hypothetical protein
MFVWKEWAKYKYDSIDKVYKCLFLFGFIPLFIYIDEI